MYSPLGRDGVEVSGRAKVDRDTGGAVALERGDRIGYAVGADLAGIVEADGDAGARSGSEHDQLSIEPTLDELLVTAHERGNGRGQADAGDRLEVDQIAVKRRQLVARAMGLGGNAPMLLQQLAVVEPENGLRVSDVDG